MNFAKRTMLAALASVSLSVPAAAQLPDGVRQMIDAAIATGDAKKVATVLELARVTNPEEGEALDAIEAEWKTAQAAATAKASAEKEARLGSAGFFELWSGEGELGGFHSTGNTDSIGIASSLGLKREGLRWSHRIRARADYQRQDGDTSREQFLFAYEPRRELGENMFAYGLAQFERDRFQGFDGRYAVSGGLGYKVVDREGLSLAVKAGPAYRITDYREGASVSRIAGLVAADFDWQMLDGLTLTQDANALAEGGGEVQVLVDGNNTSINLVTGLDFEITDRLRSRLSYAIDHNSNPPPDAVSTDTITRFTIIYGFGQ